MTQAEFEKEFVGKIICGDCLDVMKDWPDGCVNTIITDPPYGLNIANHGWIGTSRLATCRYYGKSDWDKNIPPKEVFDEIKRVSHNQLIWGGNYFTDFLGRSSHWIFWDKDNFDNDFSDGELAWTSFSLTSVRRFKYRWAGMLQEPNYAKEERVHPTQKPLALGLWIVNRYSKLNDLILDCYCGSGTFCIAAKKLGRRYIGIDISPDYCQIARERLKAVDTGVPVKEARRGQKALFE